MMGAPKPVLVKHPNPPVDENGFEYTKPRETFWQKVKNHHLGMEPQWRQSILTADYQWQWTMVRGPKARFFEAAIFTGMAYFAMRAYTDVLQHMLY